jgi:hypothetical protein
MMLMSSRPRFAIPKGSATSAQSHRRRTGACIAYTHVDTADGCAHARALIAPQALAASPNSRTLYVVGYRQNPYPPLAEIAIIRTH